MVHHSRQIAVDVFRAQVVTVVLVLLRDDELLELLVEQELHIADVAGSTDNSVRSDLLETLNIGETCKGTVGSCRSLAPGVIAS